MTPNEIKAKRIQIGLEAGFNLARLRLEQLSLQVRGRPFEAIAVECAIATLLYQTSIALRAVGRPELSGPSRTIGVSRGPEG
jgi:hypothetical protein